jgi:hypothetical protein
VLTELKVTVPGFASIDVVPWVPATNSRFPPEAPLAPVRATAPEVIEPGVSAIREPANCPGPAAVDVMAPIERLRDAPPAVPDANMIRPPEPDPDNVLADELMPAVDSEVAAVRLTVAPDAIVLEVSTVPVTFKERA